jgi:hypothetical protein
MMVRFLLDEHVHPGMVAMCRRAVPVIDIVHVGDPSAPPLGTLDPELLLYCESEHRMLLTRDYSTMPGHIHNHLAQGHHHWGVLYLRRGYGIDAYVHEVQLITEASQADEWQDVEDWIPF